MQPVGIKISVDGGKAFKTELSDIAAKSRQLKSEMDKVTATFDKNATAQDKARAKMKVLGNQMQNLKSRLTTLKTQEKQQADSLRRIAAELDKAKQKYGLNSTQVQKLTATYQKQEAALARTRTEINRTETSLAGMENEMRELQTTANKFNGNLKMEKFAASCEKASSKLKTVGSSMASMGRTMSTYVTAPVAAGFGAAIKLASDYNENLNKTQEVFGKNSKAVIKFANTATSQFGISKSNALDMASLFGDMATSMGLPTAEAAKMSTALTGLAGDVASFKNLPLEEAQTALAGIFTGETESLKRLGVVMTDANVAQYALANGAQKAYKDMSQAEKVEWRYKYVTDALKNSQGDYARTSDQTANQLRTFKENLSNLAATIGQNLLPIVNNIVAKFNDWATKFGELSPTAQKIILVVAGIVAAIGPLILIVGMLMSAIGSIMAVAPMIAVAVGSISLPILGIVAAITAAIAVAALIIKNWDKIKAKSIEIWEAIKEKVATAIEGIKTTVSTGLEAVKSFFVTIWGGIKAVVLGVFNGIKFIITTYIMVWKTIITAVLNAIKLVFTKVFGTLKTIITAPFKAILAVTKTVWTAIKNAMINPITTAYNKVRSIIKRVKSLFPIKVGNLLKGIKLPHFKITGSFSLKNKTVPKLGISWYKKAATEGAIFKTPQVIGVGDASQPEMLIGQNTLQDMFNNRGSDIDPAMIYQAVRQGASDATMQIYLDDRQVTRSLRGLGVAFI